MAQQTFAGLAALVALAFALLAASACANSEHRTRGVIGPSAATPEGASHVATPEFHGAAVGGDFLRSRLESEA